MNKNEREKITNQIIRNIEIRDARIAKLEKALWDISQFDSRAGYYLGDAVTTAEKALEE